MAAANKVAIQKSNTRCTFKITSATATGADTATISLTTDMAFTDGSGNVQAIASPKADICRVTYSAPSSGYVNITRNGKSIATLFGHDSLAGHLWSEENGSDVVVTFSGGGTLLIELVKVEGYGPVLRDITGT